MFKTINFDKYSIPSGLRNFCNECAKDGVYNNSSIDAMKIGKFSKEAWWATVTIENKIISVSGMYYFPEISKDCWRVLFRTATLKKYRALAGPISKKFTHDFNWSTLLPLQIDYGKKHKGKLFVFTTNSSEDGDENSLKTNRVISRALVKAGLIKLLEKDITLYNTKQNLWQIIQ